MNQDKFFGSVILAAGILVFLLSLLFLLAGDDAAWLWRITAAYGVVMAAAGGRVYLEAKPTIYRKRGWS